MTGELLAHLDPGRVLADLAGVRRATADGRGAQRLAFTPGWREARRELLSRMPQDGIQASTDAAGNLWLTHDGAGDQLVVIGSHLDSVPDGGDFDGVLGVLAGLEVLRANAACEQPDARLALIDFADEEGARFGFSLFGSTALAGELPGHVAELRDADGVTLAQAAADAGVDVSAANDAATGLRRIAAYLELHVEQGEVLERRGQTVAAVAGATGIARYAVELHGQSTHAGAIAMDERRDPMLALADVIVAVRERACVLEGLATVGRVELVPNVPTAVPAQVVATFDLRHPDSAALDELVGELHRSVDAAGAIHRCRTRVSPLWQMPATPFDERLITLAATAAAKAGGSYETVLSARGHDAVVLARHVPAAMLFVPSANGLSHCREEHTADEHVKAGVKALALLAAAVLSHDRQEAQT